MAGRRSAAPRPPIIAQKIIIDSKFWVSVIAIAPNPYPKSPRIYAFFLPIKSPILLPTSMKAADTSASRAIADCTPLTVVCKSLTTDEIETFIKEVSMTSTNIAAAKRSERVVGLFSLLTDLLRQLENNVLRPTNVAELIHSKFFYLTEGFR